MRSIVSDRRMPWSLKYIRPATEACSSAEHAHQRCWQRIDGHCLQGGYVVVSVNSWNDDSSEASLAYVAKLRIVA